MVYRKMLRSKIHRATLSAADIDYEGSITLPPELMQAADLQEYEAVHVWDVTNGARFETYAILGQKSGYICVNGAAARLVKPGDTVIIAAFADVPEAELGGFRTRIVLVDRENRIKQNR